MKISLKIFSSYVVRLVGFICNVAAVISALTLAVTHAPGARGKINLGLEYTLVLLAAILFVIPGRYLIKRGRRLAVLSAEELLNKDRRPPVLYLRSFNDDQEAAETVGKNPEPGLGLSDLRGEIYSISDMVSSLSEEEVLARTLSQFGPPVAVGIPGEELPPLGFARLYYPDEIWQERVLQHMRDARLVVMRAGYTKSFLEELRMMVTENIDPKKLVILLPFDPAAPSTTSILGDSPSAAYARFCSNAEEYLPHQLPMFTGNRLYGTQLSGIIWFGDDWSPRIFNLRNAGRTAAEALHVVFSYIRDDDPSILKRNKRIALSVFAVLSVIGVLTFRIALDADSSSPLSFVPGLVSLGIPASLFVWSWMDVRERHLWFGWPSRIGFTLSMLTFVFPITFLIYLFVSRPVRQFLISLAWAASYLIGVYALFQLAGMVF
jgi:hypothetical protein